MTGGAETKPDKYDDRLAQAVEHLRSNVKWTLIAFGAIGTTLLAGSQLSNIGKFAWDDTRLWLALAAALITLLAAAYAVRASLLVAFAGYTEFYDLSEDDIAYVQQNPALLEGFASVADLRAAYEQCIAERHATLTAAIKDPAAIHHYEIWFAYLDRLVDRVLAYIRFNRIRLQSAEARQQLFAASIIAAVFLIVFAWASNPVEEQKTTVLRGPPSSAQLTLSEAGKAAFSSALGAQCIAGAQLPVILLGVTGGKFDVVTLKTADCAVARLTIDDSLGQLSLTSN